MSDWEAHVDDEQRTFYWNRVTGEVSWELPEERASESSSLPTGWEERLDEEGRTYYWNSVTGDVQWDAPTAGGTTTTDAEQSGENVDGKTGLPEGWSEHTDESGRTFFWNADSGAVQWDPPTQLGIGAVDDAKKADEVAIAAVAADAQERRELEAARERERELLDEMIELRKQVTSLEEREVATKALQSQIQDLQKKLETATEEAASAKATAAALTTSSSDGSGNNDDNSDGNNEALRKEVTRLTSEVASVREALVEAEQAVNDWKGEAQAKQTMVDKLSLDLHDRSTQQRRRSVESTTSSSAAGVNADRLQAEIGLLNKYIEALVEHKTLAQVRVASLEEVVAANNLPFFGEDLSEAMAAALAKASAAATEMADYAAETAVLVGDYANETATYVGDVAAETAHSLTTSERDGVASPPTSPQARSTTTSSNDGGAQTTQAPNPYAGIPAGDEKGFFSGVMDALGVGDEAANDAADDHIRERTNAIDAKAVVGGGGIGDDDAVDDDELAALRRKRRQHLKEETSKHPPPDAQTHANASTHGGDKAPSTPLAGSSNAPNTIETADSSTAVDPAEEEAGVLSTITTWFSPPPEVRPPGMEDVVVYPDFASPSKPKTTETKPTAPTTLPAHVAGSHIKPRAWVPPSTSKSQLQAAIANSPGTPTKGGRSRINRR